MSHPNSADRTLNMMFNGVPAAGDETRAFVQLVLKLLSLADTGETLAGPSECVRQVYAITGRDDLAGKAFDAALNTAATQYARGR